jgi:hypothetical protein
VARMDGARSSMENRTARVLEYAIFGARYATSLAALARANNQLEFGDSVSDSGT